MTSIICNIGRMDHKAAQQPDIGVDIEIKMSRLHLSFHHMDVVRLKHNRLLEMEHRVDSLRQDYRNKILNRKTLMIFQILESQQVFSVYHTKIFKMNAIGENPVFRTGNHAVDIELLHQFCHSERTRTDGQHHLALSVQSMHVAHIVMVFLAGDSEKHEK